MYVTRKRCKRRIHFEQLQNDIVVVFGVILGLTEGFHGINVHEFGDACSNELGGHYNPEKRSHGSPLASTDTLEI